MPKPSKARLQCLLDLFGDQPTDLRPAVRWLMLGRSMAETWFPEFVEEPDLRQLLVLKHWVQSQEPELLDAFTSLVAASPHAACLEAETQLDALADRDPATWNHPAQVVPRPRRPPQKLLAVCQGRMDQPGGPHGKRRLRSVARKLRKVIQLEAAARRRRKQMRLGSRGLEFETLRGDAQRWATQR